MAVKITQKSTGRVAVSGGAATPLSSGKKGTKDEEQKQLGITATSTSGRVKITKRTDTQSTTAPKQQEEAEGGIKTVFDRIWEGFKKTNIGGLKSSGASNINAMGTAYAAGQGTRSAMNQDNVDLSQRALERAQRDLDIMVQEGWDAEDIQNQKAMIADLQLRAGAYQQVDEAQKKTVEETYKIADTVQESAQKDIERAKEVAYLDKAGEMLVDAGASMAQVAGDTAANAALGLAGSKLPFAFRAFGGGAQAARQDGADLQGQLLYGGASAAKEVITEMMFNTALPFSTAYGKGSLDDFVQKGITNTVERLAKTSGGQRALNGLLQIAASSGGEGLEEFIGDWMEWQMPRLYGGDTATAQETFENSLYDFLVGAMSGGVGSVISPGTYRYEGPQADDAKNTSVSAPNAPKMAGQSENKGVIRNDTLRRVAEQMAAEGKVSGKNADRILADPEAVSALTEASGVELDPAMTQSQRRSAVKTAVEGLARERESVSAETRETAAPTAAQRVTAPASVQQSVQTRQDHSAVFGENGQKAYKLGMQGALREEVFYPEFTKAYNAGLNGKKLTSAGVQYLTRAQAGAAYEAGRSDAAATLAKEKAAAPYAKAFGKDSGLVYDDYVAANLDNQTVQTLNTVAKMLGTRVRFVDSVAGGQANARIRDGEILVEKNNPNPVRFLLGHEWTHRLQELAPEEYSRFRAAVAEDDTITYQVEAMLAAYAKNDVDITYEEALDEVVADYAGRMVEDGDFLERFIEQHRSDRTLLERIRDAIRDMVSRLTGEHRRQAQTAEGKLTAALDAAAKQAARLEANKNAAHEGDSRFSIKRTSKMSLAAQLKMFYDGKMASSDAFYFGNTPASLGATGLDQLPLAFTIADFKKSTQKKHNIPRRVLKNLLHDLETAQFAFADGDRLGILTTDIDGDGKPLLVAIQKNVQMDADKVNAIRSLYGLDHPDAWVRNQIADGKTFILLDEEKANTTLYPYGYMASRKDGIRSLEGTVTRNEPESKEKFSLKGTEQLAEEINRIVKDGHATGKSESDIRADIRAAVEEVYQGMISDYGTIKSGENPARDIKVPKRTDKDRKVSQTVRTILEAKATPEAIIPDIEELVARGDFSYDSYTDKQAISDAAREIEHVGWAQAISDWTETVEKGEVSKKNTAMGWALYNNAANTGDTKTALTILQRMAEHQRSAAQALQATRILKKLPPETQLYQAQRSVESLQEELNKRYGEKNSPALKVDQGLAERFMQAKDQEARDAALRDIYRDIGRQMPSRFRDKWNAWRYLSMLGNPRTHVRNVLGNAGFAPVVAVKNLTATVIETAVSRVSGGKLERTKGAVGFGKKDRALLHAAWNDYAKVQEDALSGGKYSDFANANKYIEEGRRIFRTGALETVRKANSAALDKEDVWFSKPHYAAAMAGYCKAHGITAEQIAAGKGLKQAREYAVLEAQKATYRDTNAFSQTMSELGRTVRPGKNPVRKAVGLTMEGILPFRKTPANILARGVEYSPIGLINGIKQALVDVQKGTKTGAEAIDSISAGLTGTGLLALGVYLAAQGLVRGHGGTDEEEKVFEELMGHQVYSLELSDGSSVTLDWLAPECLPFFVGVNLWEQTGGEKDELTLSTMLSSVATVSEPLLEMSRLQSLNDVFDAVGYAASDGLDGLPAALASAATSYLTQALPTILGQVERTSENMRNTTYTEKNAFLTSDMQYTLGRASARLPGVDYQQIPYIDAWGRTEQTGTSAERAFNNFVNPAYTTKIDTSKMEEELLRLYRATGEAGVLPKRAAKYFTVDGERKDLTAEEYVTYATKKGQNAYKLLRDLTASKQYQKLSDAEKADAVKEVYDLANQTAKASISDYGPESWIQKAVEAQRKYGISQDVYISLKTSTADIQSLKDADGETIANSKGLLIMQEVYKAPGLTDQQRTAMFEYLGVGKTIRHWNKTLVNDKLREMKRASQ